MQKTTSAMAVAAAAIVWSPHVRADDGKSVGDAAQDLEAVEKRAVAQAAEEKRREDLDFSAFRRVHDAHHVRAALEVGGVLVVGFVDYLLNTGARGGEVKAGDPKWSFRYDWDDLRRKLGGQSYNLDANRFGTNYASHPFAGTMYFTAARSNHLSFAESYLFAIAGSTSWEFFAEIREPTSINDLIVTPVAGTAIGETTVELSEFFRRGRPTVANRILSTVFSPVKVLNEWACDRDREAEETDALGFPTGPYHEFELYGGGGLTHQGHGPRTLAASYGDVRLGASFTVVNLPDYKRAGHHGRLFDDGNVATLRFDLGAGDGGLVDGRFLTRIVPVGYYYRNADVDAKGDVVGHGALVGVRMSYEYTAHDWDRDRARPRDVVALVSPFGVAAEHTFDAGDLHVRTAVDASFAIAGVHAYGLTEYYAAGGKADGLMTQIKADGYYHAFSVSVAPEVEVRLGRVGLRSWMRVDTFRPIRGLDENQPTVDDSVRMGDRRTAIGTKLSFDARPLRVGLGVERAEREGEFGSAHSDRSELTVSATAGLVF